MRAVIFGAAFASAHYGKPPCASDERQKVIPGASGKEVVVACSPSCDPHTGGYDPAKPFCSQDVPKGVSAKPSCFPTGFPRGFPSVWGDLGECSLFCHSDDECGDAKCQKGSRQAPGLGDTGICAYPPAEEAVLEATTPCCGSCTAPQKKYFSIDTKRNMCGEVCINPLWFRLFKVFEPSLAGPVGDDEVICKEKHFSTYNTTVTHGAGPIHVTLDLYNPDAAVPEATSPWEAKFEQFIKDFEKEYMDSEEQAMRAGVFHENLKFIEEHNAQGHSYTLGVGPYADMTSDEFKEHYMGLNSGSFMDGESLGVHTAVEDFAVPHSVDWRTKGAVTPVKDQGQCGSCWAFSSTGALEGANFLTNGKLISLSEQQFVDCAGLRYGNLACHGGTQSRAFSYAESHAIDTEESYPYTGKGGFFRTCKTSSGTIGLPKGAITGYKTVDHSEAALEQAVAQQPIAVSIEADQNIFHHYKSGIITGSACGAQLDHAVLAVGYGTDAGKDYWIVKNSWTATWGEAGYVRIIRGTDECGILNGPPVYPIIKKAGEESDTQDLVV